MANETVLTTNILKVYWQMQGKPKVTKLCLGEEEPREVSWFDELFLSRIKVFEVTDEQHHPVTLLLKGPLGDEKTTLALELCYRLAKTVLAALGTTPAFLFCE